MTPINAIEFTEEIAALLKRGGIGVLRTDTLYGLVAVAANQAAVERVYKVKQRTPSKSPIILVDSADQLFDSYDEATLERLNTLWPGKNSIILSSAKAPLWIERGNQSVAYRVPDNTALRELLKQTGPLIAPSANPEGEPPAMNISQAKAYFGSNVDFYVDGGEVTSATPSKLYRLNAEGMERLR